MHVLLRPSEGRADAGVRDGVSDRIDSVRALDELRARAEKRVADLQARGIADAVYNPVDTSVGGIHAFFLLLGPPEEFGLPPRPEVPTVYLSGAWLSAAMTSALALAGACLAFALM